MYNLNTKRALVEDGGTMEWVSGSFGSHVSYLYPMTILKGDRSRMEFTGITFAGKGQNLDTGAKVVHIGKETSSFMNTRSIPMPENPVRTVYGLGHLNQTTAKVHYSMIPM